MRPIRKSRFITSVAVIGVVVPGVALTASADTADSSSDLVARAVIRDVNGVTLGTIQLSAQRGELEMSGRLGGLSAGFHGFHVHSVGICNPRATDPAGTVVPFFTAGGHLNPSGSGHGSHAGDLPLLNVSSDGTTITATESDKLNTSVLFDADGSAFIIHAAPDNYAHIPARYSAGGVPGPDAATLATGDAGGRIACGLITRP
jgi:superoxide dismutase, Cu-Zn family